MPFCVYGLYKYSVVKILNTNNCVLNSDILVASYLFVMWTVTNMRSGGQPAEE
jgi:hypothetical protein